MSYESKSKQFLSYKSTFKLKYIDKKTLFHKMLYYEIWMLNNEDKIFNLNNFKRKERRLHAYVARK